MTLLYHPYCTNHFLSFNSQKNFSHFFRFLGHTFPVFGSHFSGFWVTLFRFLGHTFPVFESHFSGFWVTLFRFLGHTFPVFGSSIVPARPGLSSWVTLFRYAVKYIGHCLLLSNQFFVLLYLFTFLLVFIARNLIVRTCRRQVNLNMRYI